MKNKVTQSTDFFEEIKKFKIKIYENRNNEDNYLTLYQKVYCLVIEGSSKMPSKQKKYKRQLELYKEYLEENEYNRIIGAKKLKEILEGHEYYLHGKIKFARQKIPSSCRSFCSDARKRAKSSKGRREFSFLIDSDNIIKQLEKFRNTHKKGGCLISILEKLLNEQKNLEDEEGNRLLDEEYKLSDIYHNIGMPQQSFSRIVIENKASRMTLFRFAIELKLNFEQTKELLENCGYTFDTNRDEDLTMLFCLENKVYDWEVFKVSLNHFKTINL